MDAKREGFAAISKKDGSLEKFEGDLQGRCSKRDIGSALISGDGER